MLNRWNPFDEISRIQDEMARTLGGATENRAFRPAVDIFESDDAIHLTAELPGVQREDVHLDLEDNVLTLTGERKLQNEKKLDGYHRVERSYGKFTRSFVLPRTVDTQGIDAELTNGVLHVTLPKRLESKQRRIAVRSTSAAPANGAYADATSANGANGKESNVEEAPSAPM